MAQGTAAEVMERADAGPGALTARAAGRSGREDRSAGIAPDGWRRFTVDVWITDLNAVEFGIYRRSRNRAKSRQFSTDMDIFAEVTEEGQRTGLIGYREDLWKNNTGMDKRLAFKLFSDTLNWRATMELMVGRSLQLTLGARGLPVTAYAVNTHEDNSIVYLERSANKWPLMPENFSFFIVRDGGPVFYRLRHDLVSVGGDYTLLDERNRKVGHIDGRLFSLGGYWKGRVRAEHADRKLMAVMKLFAGTIGFNSACRRHMVRLWADVRAGRLEPKLDRHEAEYYLNPRRVR
ncbi:MAG: hypothetical protein KJZ80_07985 [Hyphomicrobiaceae bacterium]|nr:hypothetical protein [Hyphomicrobiaceae bacterium]